MNTACPACGAASSRVLYRGTDRLYRTTAKQFAVAECGQCRLLRLEPRPAGRELAKFYPPDYWFAPGAGTAGRLEEAYRRIVLRDHVSFVRRAAKAAGGTGLVLDVGCGGGLFLRELAHPRPLGIDNSPQAAAVAWRQNRVPAICGDVTHAPLRPASCAVVTMFHVLEHLPEPVPFLRAVHGLLAADGRLVLQVPNADCWQFRLLGQRWNGLDIPRHLFNYRARDLENLLAYSGFTVLRRKHFSLRDNPAGLATSIAPALDPMARRMRGRREGAPMRLFRDLLYFGLTVASLPFAIAEAAFGAGSTIMIEARKQA